MSTPSPYRAPETPVRARPIVVTTGPDVPGHRVVTIVGVVHGFAMRPHPEFSNKTVEQAIEARRRAGEALLDQAAQMGADAVIGMRYDSNDYDVVAYGTAVRLEPTT